MLLIELTGAVDSVPTLKTFYFSTDNFATSPTDVPANIAFENRIINPASLGVHAFSDAKTGSNTKLEVGEVVLANADGVLDNWINYSFDGRPIIIRYGTSGSYPSDFPIVLQGTVDSIEASWRSITIRLRDKQYMFSTKLLTNKYLGNNVLPNGFEGVEQDLKGKVKPKVFGKVFNISPPLVNTSKLIYQVNDGAVVDIPAVYSRGNGLTKGSDYATSALLAAATIPSGYYATCFAEGYFRINFTLDGIISCDVTQGAASSDRTAAQIIKAVSILAGVNSSDISSSDVSAMDSACNYECGIYIDSEDTSQVVLDKVASSVGAYYGFDGNGKLRMGILTNPTGTPSVYLYDYMISDNIERRTDKEINIPTYSVTVNYARNNTVQATDVAGAVSADRRNYLAQEYRNINIKDNAIKTMWLLSTEYILDTVISNATDATTEATRLLNLYKQRRDIFEVSTDLSFVPSLKMLDVVNLKLDRFGLSSGKLFRVIGIRYELGINKIFLTLWG